MKALQNYLKATAKAGFTVYADEHQLVVEREADFIILCKDEMMDDQYLVNIFYKEAGDYGVPTIEGSLIECLDWMKENV